MTPVEQVFYAIEETDLSLWVRGESLFAFPTILTFHTIGLGLLVGASVVISLRILGFARGVPIPVLEKFYPVIWAGFVVNFASGMLLLIGYPYKAFTNPVFYVKLACVTLGMFLVLKIRNEVLRAPAFMGAAVAMGGGAFTVAAGPGPQVQAGALTRARVLALLTLASWAGAIAAGRLLAYTYRWLRVGVTGGF